MPSCHPTRYPTPSPLSFLFPPSSPPFFPFSQILPSSPVRVFSLPPSLISVLTAGGGRFVSPPSPEILLEKNKISRKPKSASLCPGPPCRRGPPDSPRPDQFIPVTPSRRYRERIYLGHQPAPPSGTLWPPQPHTSHLWRGRCARSRDAAAATPAGGVCVCPRSPVPPHPGRQRARGCRCPGASARRGPPQPPGRLPGGCSPPEGGGERQAGAEAGLARPPPPALRLPPPGSVPPAPRPEGNPHPRGRPAGGSESVCPEQGWF